MCVVRVPARLRESAAPRAARPVVKALPVRATNLQPARHRQTRDVSHSRSALAASAGAIAVREALGAER